MEHAPHAVKGLIIGLLDYRDFLKKKIKIKISQIVKIFNATHRSDDLNSCITFDKCVFRITKCSNI